MFCQDCGKELADDAMFCPACGKKRAKMPDMGNLQDVDAEQNKKEPSKDADAEKSRKEPSMGAEAANHGTGEKEPGGNIFSRIWNSPLFTKVAIKFGNLLEILEGIVFFILSKLLFNEGGFWGVAFGIFCALAGLGGCISGIISLLRWKKSGDEDEMLDETDIKKKKRNLCIGIVLIVIACFSCWSASLFRISSSNASQISSILSFIKIFSFSKFNSFKKSVIIMFLFLSLYVPY